LQIETDGQTVLTPRAIFTSIETVLITTNITNYALITPGKTTVVYVTPTYTYYSNNTFFNLTLTTQITYNVQYGEYDIKYGGSTSTVALYTPTPQSITYKLPVEVLNINGTLLTTYSGTIEFPTTLVTTYVTYTTKAPITYINYVPTIPAINSKTTYLSEPITVTTQVVFSLPSQVSIEKGKGNIVVTIFEKNVTNQFKVGADICQNVTQGLGSQQSRSQPFSCLIQYSSTTTTEFKFVAYSAYYISTAINSNTGITIKSTTFIPAQHCTPFNNSVVTIQSPIATYNGGKYKLEIQPQGISFSLGNIYICPTILVQQINILNYITTQP